MKILSFLLLINTVCYCQLSTISGNAFWKYNDYVGNKPDAGSYVYLYSSDSSTTSKSTQCDVMGNFKFENIKPGRYLIAIFSQNTKTWGDENLDALKEVNTSNYLGFNVFDLDPVLYDSILFYRDEYYKAMNQKMKTSGIKKWTDNVLNKGNIYKNSIYRLMNKAPISLKLNPFQITLPIQRRFILKEIIIKDGENSTVIADFGLTQI
jgi:hypothetical protein